MGTLQGEAIFAWNHEGVLYRVRHIGHHALLHSWTHVLQVFHHRHHGIGLRTLQLIEVYCHRNNGGVDRIAYYSHPIAY